MDSIPAEVADLLKVRNVSQYFEVDGVKLKCILNGHCLPLSNCAQLATLLGGKKFSKMVAVEEERVKLKKLEPFLIPSERLKGYLFCTLTRQMVRAHADTAKQHMRGAKFLHTKKRFMEDAMDLYAEPTDEAKPGRKKKSATVEKSEATVSPASDEEDMSESQEAEEDMSESLEADEDMDAEECESVDTIRDEAKAAARKRKKAEKREKAAIRIASRMARTSVTASSGKQKRALESDGPSAGPKKVKKSV